MDEDLLRLGQEPSDGGLPVPLVELEMILVALVRNPQPATTEDATDRQQCVDARCHKGNFPLLDVNLVDGDALHTAVDEGRGKDVQVRMPHEEIPQNGVGVHDLRGGTGREWVVMRDTKASHQKAGQPGRFPHFCNGELPRVHPPTATIRPNPEICSRPSLAKGAELT